jgi:hypothetical protein
MRRKLRVGLYSIIGPVFSLNGVKQATPFNLALALLNMRNSGLLDSSQERTCGTSHKAVELPKYQPSRQDAVPLCYRPYQIYGRFGE